MDEGALIGLREIRMPVPDGPMILAEGLAALAVGLVLALLLAGMVRMVTRRAATREASPPEMLAEAESLPAEARLLVLGRVLRQVSPDRPFADAETLRAALYRPADPAEVARLHTALAAHLARGT